eukprot:Awhi_evm1s1078
MKLFAIIASVASVNAVTLQQAPSANAAAEFDAWKVEHGKVYERDIEHKMRFGIWESNKQKIDDFNMHEEKSYELKMNEFGDLTHDEFKVRNGYNSNAYVKDPTRPTHHRDPKVAIPDSIDWRDHDVVSPVKNQGSCGSCYSFSATGSLEACYKKKYGKQALLSEQQVLDCSKKNFGCGGGLMDLVFKYVEKAGGLDTEKEYPYRARQQRSCKAIKEDEIAPVHSFVDVAQGDEEALKEALATVAPVSVAIDASHWSFQFYHKGVYNEVQCSSTQLDHGVLAVGYGSMHGKDYWIVKNSWGASWGQKGYLLMSRNKDNQCGIATTASYPIC